MNTRLEALIRKHLDRTATAAESREFDLLLRDDPVAAARFAEVARLDAALIALLHDERAVATTQRMFERAETSHDEFEPMPARPRRSWLRRHRWPVLAATVLLITSAAIGFWQSRQPLGKPEWQLVQQPAPEDAVSPGSEVVSGQALVDGKQVKTVVDGSVVQAGKREPLRLKLADGTEAKLSPTTSAVVHGPVPGLRQLVELLEGSASFRVEKGDAQFQVDTPRGRVTVLGTEFDVNLIKNKLIVTVLTGVVQIDLPSKPPLVVVGPERMEFSPEESPKKPQRELRAIFVSGDKDQVAVSMKGAREVKLELTPDARTWINGRLGRLQDIPSGTVVVLRRADEKSPVQEIRAEGQVHAGEVLGVDREARKITLLVSLKVKEAGGSVKEIVYRVADDARITVDGKSSGLDDLRIGLKVTVEKSLDGNAVVAIAGGSKKVKQP
jgi:ferric-dicitrate binding protein FerR (iron transport regulator)